MVFGYTVEQASKFLVSAVIFAAAAVGLFVFVDPNLTQALVTLVPLGFGAAQVFLNKNSTEDDYSKAVSQLQAATLSVVAFFVTVPAATVTQFSLLVAAGLSAYFVAKKGNAPVVS